MSFTISLRKNTSPVNYVNKDTTELLSATGSLRDGTSIIDPVIIFESDSSHFLADLNYMYISEFNRYYFVTNIISLRTNLWQITAHVDVLMSWKTELLESGNGVVKRQENKYNLYLDDGIFKCYQDPLIQCINFPSGFTTQEFVLAVAGANAVNNSPTPDPSAPDVPTPGVTPYNPSIFKLTAEYQFVYVAGGSSYYNATGTNTSVFCFTITGGTPFYFASPNNTKFKMARYQSGSGYWEVPNWGSWSQDSTTGLYYASRADHTASSVNSDIPSFSTLADGLYDVKYYLEHQ